jgi:hypothetical protein
MHYSKPRYGAFFVSIDYMREEEQYTIHKPESYSPWVEWCFTGRGSIYAAEAFGDNTYIFGGSTWDRRHTPFTSEARNAEGLLSKVIRQGDELREESQLIFPSMINAIVPFGNSLFVGCKRGDRSFNLLGSDFQLLRSQSDEIGDGIYNAVPFGSTGDLLVATRNGYLYRLDPVTLSAVRTLQLNNGDTRLWSLAVRSADRSIFVGDYNGHVYCVDCDLNLRYTLQITDYIDESLPQENRRYNPSVFGITVAPGEQIVTTVRWGQIDWFDVDTSGFKHVKSLTIPEEISQITCIGPNNFLIGTRSGKLLHLIDDDEYCVNQLLHIPPAYQSDNAVWSIANTFDRGILVCFADGQVVRLNMHGLIREG